MPRAAACGALARFLWSARAALVLGMLLATPAAARPNTHAPAISTWDTRASSVVLALGRAVSGDGDFTSTSYNANFSSTSGVLSAQFGAHYLTYADSESSRVARGFSAGGVALFSLPLTTRLENRLPSTSFAFYLGGVPTALFSGQRNFISVPFVMGIGLPFSPLEELTLSPWVELSPGLNFDTRIQEVSTEEAVQSAMDGTLTRAEVEELVEQGLRIDRESALGKRGGLALELHLGRAVDLAAHVTLGIGHASAFGLGGAFVFRWDDFVPGVQAESAAGSRKDCSSVEARLRACAAAYRTLRRRPGAAPSNDNRPAPPRRLRRDLRPSPPGALPSQQGTAPPQTPARPGTKKTTQSDERKKRAPAAPIAPAAPAAPERAPKAPELPPLQGAPPRQP